MQRGAAPTDEPTAADSDGGRGRRDGTTFLAMVVVMTFIIGLPMVRMFAVGLAVQRTQVQDRDPITAGVIGIAVFASPLLIPLLRRLPVRSAFPAAISISALALFRLVIQFTGDPAVDFWLALAGSAAFLISITLLSNGDGRLHLSTGWFAFAALIGIASDFALKGAWGTVELSWSNSAWADLVATGLVIATALVLLAAFTGKRRRGGEGERAVRSPALNFVLGPVLLIELLLLGNLAQLSALTGWEQPFVFGWLVFSMLVGLGVAIAILNIQRRVAAAVPIVIAGALALILIGERTGVAAALVVMAGQVGVGAIIAFAARSDIETVQQRFAWVWSSTGWLVFATGLFGYYAATAINVPVPRSVIVATCTALIALPFLMTAGRRAIASPIHVNWKYAVASLGLLVFPIVAFASWSEPSSRTGDGLPVRVMSYKLHQGFDVDGRLRLEEMAQVIESQEPDIVGLQEVSRGWVINDSIDVLEWLSQRLDMPYAWGPAADSAWGNAVLTRLPISSVEIIDMPNNDDILMDRSFMAVGVDIGSGEILTVIATHFHFRSADSRHRIPQSQAVIDYWGGARRTVLLGDLNARPTAPEITMLEDAGMRDAFIASGAEAPGHTWAAPEIFKRIDYIWTSADLKARDFVTVGTVVSNHLAVAATIYR